MKFDLQRLSIDEIGKSFDILQFIKYNNGLVFHEPELNRIVSELFNTKFYYLSVSFDSEVVAICPIHTIKQGIVRISETKPLYDIPYGGFVFDNSKVSEEELIRILKPALNEKILYYSNPFNFSKVKSWQSYFKKETAIIDLTLNEKDIWMKVINSKRRNMIRKAQKSEILVKRYFTFEGFELFWPLLSSLHTIIGKGQLNKQYYKKILEQYLSINKACIFVAIKNGKILSGVVLLGNKNVMHYWKGASDFSFNSEGQSELLQWEAIKWAKNNGVKYYDLCVIETDRLSRIAKFKMGFSKQLLPFQFFLQRSYTYRIINKIQKLFL